MICGYVRLQIESRVIEETHQKGHITNHEDQNNDHSHKSVSLLPLTTGSDTSPLLEGESGRVFLLHPQLLHHPHGEEQQYGYGQPSLPFCYTHQDGITAATRLDLECAILPFGVELEPSDTDER